MQSTVKRNYLIERFAFPFAISAALGWWLWFRLHTGRTFEDAFITFRFARNIALGNGFVFNPGERVLGTTTPLQTLLLATIGKVVGIQNIPIAASILMFCVGVATGLLTYTIFQRFGYSRNWSVVAMILFFGNNVLTLTSVAGMETPMALFFMALSIHFLLTERYTLAIFACSLLVLTRIDGSVWLLLCLVSVGIKARRIPWKALLVACAVLIPWFLFSWSYFGTIVPHTVIAKREIGAPLPVSLAHPQSVLFFLAWYLKALGCGHPVMLVIWPFIILAGFWKWWHYSGEYRWIARVIVLFPFLFGLFLLVGNAQHFDWYLMPPLWCCLILSTAGLRELWLWLTQRLRVPVVRRSVAFGLLFVSLAVYFVSQNIGRVERNRRFQSNESMRRSLGLWLHNNTPADSLVMMEAIGYQGYFSQRKILDIAGLFSPIVVKIHRESHSNTDSFYKLISDQKPDYLVLRSFEVDHNQHFHGGPLFENPVQKGYFQQHYKELKRFNGPYPDPQVWGEIWHLTVFGRVDRRPKSG